MTTQARISAWNVLAFGLTVVTSSAALAQSGPAVQNDPAFLQRAVAALQAQRNVALDTAAAQQARADGLAEELARAQAEVKTCTSKLEKQGDGK